jgi:hypothetical protein
MGIAAAAFCFTGATSLETVGAMVILAGIVCFSHGICLLQARPSRQQAYYLGQHDQEFQEVVEPVDLPVAPRRWEYGAALLGLGVAILLPLAPEGLRLARGWPRNDRAVPAVIGPGDAMTVSFRQSVSTLQGRWRGMASASILGANPQTDPPIILAAESSKRDWGDMISGRDNLPTTTTVYPWVTCLMPSDETLAGRTVLVKLGVTVAYPYPSGPKQFTNSSRSFAESIEIRFARDPYAGFIYQLLGWSSSLAAVVLAGAMGLLLFTLARRRLGRDTWRANVMAELARNKPPKVSEGWG